MKLRKGKRKLWNLSRQKGKRNMRRNKARDLKDLKVAVGAFKVVEVVEGVEVSPLEGEGCSVDVDTD